MKIIGVIIRGKYSNEHEPELMAQHADVVLSDGSPFGYFGQGQGFSADYGMFMDGVVYDYDFFRASRPHYVEIDKARALDVVSTLCVMKVDDEVARRFDQYWRSLQKKAQAGKLGFSILGNNCSTNAAEAFRYAGVLDDGIPGLDTPQNLFTQLKGKQGGNFQCASGYVGFTKIGNQMKVEVEARGD